MKLDAQEKREDGLNLAQIKEFSGLRMQLSVPKALGLSQPHIKSKHGGKFIIPAL